jgi:hypothetical protein
MGMSKIIPSTWLIRGVSPRLPLTDRQAQLQSQAEVDKMQELSPHPITMTKIEVKVLFPKVLTLFLIMRRILAKVQMINMDLMAILCLMCQTEPVWVSILDERIRVTRQIGVAVIMPLWVALEQQMMQRRRSWNYIQVVTR